MARRHSSSKERYNLLIAAQRGGNVAEAIGTLYQFTQERKRLWPTIFSWGIASKELRSRYEELLSQKIHRSDRIQIEKDLPRTKRWLRRRGERKGAKTSLDIQNQKLSRVLHAFVASAHESIQESDRPQSSGAYVQGMNGIAFVLLDVLRGNEADAFAYLYGICTELLPGLFDNNSPNGIAGVDNLSHMSEYFEDLLTEFYPRACEKCTKAGCPAGTIAVKWMLTMFSNLSFSGGDDTLRYETILAAWDICFLLGMAGVATVVVALFGYAVPHIEKLADDPAMLEELIDTLYRSIKPIPNFILYNQCAELLVPGKIHPKLKKLKDAHERKVGKTRATLRTKLSYNDPKPKGNRAGRRIHPQSQITPEPSSESVESMKNMKPKVVAVETKRDISGKKYRRLKVKKRSRKKRSSSEPQAPNEDYLAEWQYLRVPIDPFEDKGTEFAHDWLEATDETTGQYVYYNACTGALRNSRPEVGYIALNGALRLPRNNSIAG